MNLILVGLATLVSRPTLFFYPSVYIDSIPQSGMAAKHREALIT